MLKFHKEILKEFEPVGKRQKSYFSVPWLEAIIG
jgi:hypothetical protein